MFRVFAIIVMVQVLAASAGAQDWIEHPLGEEAESWTLVIGPQGEIFPDGLSIAGQPMRVLSVYPQGLVGLGGVFAGDIDADPNALVELFGQRFAAPFWARLADRDCLTRPDDVPNPTVAWQYLAETLTIEWRDMPHADCDANKGTVTVALEITAAEDGRTVLEFHYESVGEAGAFTPRAGVVFDEVVVELFDDAAGVPDRAKALLDGGSERRPLADDDEGRGVWLIELDGQGRIVGDFDLDGIREHDNCRVIPNPDQLDTDRNGDGDACDEDDDGDRVLDEDDNCLLVRNPEQVDLDRDGAGDACDGDDDGDGWFDVLDNCRGVQNIAQLDLDRDGVGDDCDPDIDGDDAHAVWPGDGCQFVSDPARKDGDGDGLGDACDLLPWIACAGMGCFRQLDSDGDGIGDEDDLCPTVSDPLQRDDDGDGIGDACDPDRDNDGMIDGLKKYFSRDLGRPELSRPGPMSFSEEFRR